MLPEELGPRRAHDQQRNTRRTVGQVLQEGEHRFVSPVQVLEQEHGRGPVGDVLDEPRPRGEQLLAFRRRRGPDPDQREQPLPEPRAVFAGGEDVVELRLRDGRGVRLEDPGMRFHDLAQRPEGDPLPVRETPALTPGREFGPRIEVREQLDHQTALPQAGFPGDGHELGRSAGDRLVEDALEEREVDLATDKRGTVRPHYVGPEPGSRRLRVEDPDRLRLALEHRRSEFLVLEDSRRGLVRGGSDRDPHLWRRRLDPRRRVDRVAAHEALPGPRRDPEPDEGLAGVDPDPDAERLPADGSQSLGCFDDPQPRPDRALGIVLVRSRDAEHAEHRVTDELLDDAPVALDRRSRHRGVLGQHPIDVLGIGRLGRGRERDEVAEQGGDDLALLGHGGSPERRRALHAELGALRVVAAACGTGDHRGNVRPGIPD
jgi:hypothetical protein